MMQFGLSIIQNDFWDFSLLRRWSTSEHSPMTAVVCLRRCLNSLRDKASDSYLSMCKRKCTR